MDITDTNVIKFMDDLKKQANYNLVDLDFLDSAAIPIEHGMACNGFFDGDDKVLSVAIGKELNEWLPIAVHESCHMDQWSENSKIWVGASPEEYDAMHLIMLWLGKKIELTNTQRNSYIAAARLVELDCERRTVEKIKKYNLPIDIDLYIKQSNAYVWFYTMVGFMRQWYEIGREPYAIPEIVDAMPSEFMDDEFYNVIPDDIFDLFKQHCIWIDEST